MAISPQKMRPRPQFRKKWVGYGKDHVRMPYYIGVSGQNQTPVHMMLQNDNSAMITVLLFGASGCLTEDTQIVSFNDSKEMFSISVSDAYRKQQEGKTIFVLGKPKGVGNLVRTPAYVLDSGEKEVYEIITEKGNIVKASADHVLFKTIANKRGYFSYIETPVSGLKIGDDLAAFDITGYAKRQKAARDSEFQASGYHILHFSGKAINNTPEVVKEQLFEVLVDPPEKIVSIKSIGVYHTYDLKVPFTENFMLSNGILSHNSGKSTLTRIIEENAYLEFLTSGKSRRHPVFIFDGKTNYAGITEKNNRERDKYLLSTIHSNFYYKNYNLRVPEDRLHVKVPAYVAPSEKEVVLKRLKARWGAEGYWGVPWRHITDLAYLGLVLKVPSDSLWCLTPETIIVTNEGGKPISQIHVGDYVLTHKGRFRKVTETLVFPYKGELINTYTRYCSEPLRSSPNHRCLTIDRRRETRNITATEMKQMLSLRNDGLTTTQLAEIYDRAPSGIWYALKHSEQYLSRGDFVIKRNNWMEDVRNGFCHLTPEFKFAGDLTLWDGFLFPRTKMEDSCLSSCSDDLLELFGWYIAEGSNDGRTVYFWLGNGERGEQEALMVVDLIKRSGLTVNPVIFEHKGCKVVRFSSTSLIRNIFKIFGKNARSKYVPTDFIDLSQQKIGRLLKGMFHGGGSLNYKGKHCLRYSTASKGLVCSLRLILSKLGVFHSVNYDSTNDKFDISIGGASNNLLRTIMDEPQPYVSLRTNSFMLPDYAYLPIDKIERTQYDGLLYHLEVEEDHTYTTLQGVVHNSEELRPTFEKCVANPEMTLKGMIGEDGELRKAAHSIRNAASKAAAIQFVDRWRKNRFWFCLDPNTSIGISDGLLGDITEGQTIQGYDTDKQVFVPVKVEHFASFVPTGLSYKLVSESGRFVIGSYNHRFITRRGLLRMERIKKGDLVAVCPYVKFAHPAPSRYEEKTIPTDAPSGFVWETVTSNEPTSCSKLCELSLKPTPYFLANGFLSHNSNDDSLAKHCDDDFSINVLTFVESPEKIYFNQLALLVALESLMARLQQSKVESQPIIIIHDILNYVGQDKPFQKQLIDAIVRLMAGQARTLAHGAIVIIETQSLDLPKELGDPKRYTFFLKMMWKSQSDSLRKIPGFLGGVMTIHDQFNNFHRSSVVVRPALTKYLV